MEDDPKKYPLPKPGNRFTVGLIAAVIVLVALTAGLVLGHDLMIKRQSSELAEEAQKGRNVVVAKVLELPTSRAIDLPATIHGYIEASIYAKVAGYLKRINVDKGDHILRGQLLAEIEAPDLDKQVVDAKANYWLQRTTDRREQALVKQGVISHQEADNSHAAMLQAQAVYAQLIAQQGYENLHAPFDGIVTARYVDPGALIPQSIDSTVGSGTPVIAIATLKPLRVYADMPQSLALFIRNGDPAKITIYERPGRVFSAPVTRHSSALDSDSRTMRVEVDLPNDDLSLYPGMYARASFTVSMTEKGQMVRDDALVFRDAKAFAPVVRDGRLHLVEVTLGYDDGRNVAVKGDLRDDDLVALNVGQAAEEGQVVHPVFGDTQ